MPRFVLLYHDCPPGYARASHWDLMLEQGPVLRTWAVEKLPQEWEVEAAAAVEAGDTVPAEQLADHRLAYLDYEGPLSGGRGSVTRVEAGSYETVDESVDDWRVILSSEKIRGQIRLRRAAPDNSRWTLSTMS
jgi:DNA polymerase Ligase (LigD)